MMDIFVKLPNGRVRPLTVRATDKLSSVTSHLESNEGLEAAKIRLSYEGKPLDQQKTFTEYGIVRETMIQSTIVSPRMLEIAVKGPDGRTESFSTRSSETLASFIGDVSHRFGVAATSALLRERSYGRALPLGPSTLDSWGIETESILDLEVKVDKGKAADAAGGSDSGPTALDKAREEEILRNFVQSAVTKKVEIVFSFDTTGSMCACLNQVRTQVKDTVSRLLADIKDIRIGIIAHGDYCDYSTKTVIRLMDLSSDPEVICKFIESVPSSGGGDSPENYEYAMRRARSMSWTESAAKALVIIGDDVPHPPSYTNLNIDWNEEIDALAAANIKVYGVRAMNNASAQPFYEEIAARTGAINIDFRDFRVITDMFLAVCYKEAGEAHLAAFEMEARDQGRLEGELTAVLATLRDGADKCKESCEGEKKSSPDYAARNVPGDWWCRAQDRGVCQFHCTDAESDTWTPCPGHEQRSAPTAPTTAPASFMHTVSLAGDAPKKRMSFRRLSLKLEARRRSCIVS